MPAVTFFSTAHFKASRNRYSPSLEVGIPKERRFRYPAVKATAGVPQSAIMGKFTVSAVGYFAAYPRTFYCFEKPRSFLRKAFYNKFSILYRCAFIG